MRDEEDPTLVKDNVYLGTSTTASPQTTTVTTSTTTLGSTTAEINFDEGPGK